LPSNAALGQAIRRVRRERRLSTEALALEAGLHPNYVSGIERGVRNPTWTKLCEVAGALVIPVSAVTGEAEHDTCPACGAPKREA
jgi:transcriptional regulator with XRE-family HTH domain